MSGAVAEYVGPTVPSQPSEPGWGLVGAGDINVDGFTDLYFYNPQYGFAYWLLVNNQMVSAGPLLYGAQPIFLGGTWKVVGVADFNGDDKPDFLVQDEDIWIGVWHLNGSQVVDCQLFDPANSGGYPGKWRATGTGDFDNDGKTDVLFQYDRPSHGYDGTLAVWYMADTTLQGVAFFNPERPADPRNRVVGTADFYRGCATDILFQFKEPRTGWGGGLTMWQMNPSSRLSRLTEETVSPANPLNVGSYNVVAPR